VLAELIHVISAVVIPRSAPTKDDITVTVPVKKEPIAIVIVAVSTKRTSCVVELKQDGRTLFVCTVVMGWRSSSPLRSADAGELGAIYCWASFSFSIASTSY